MAHEVLRNSTLAHYRILEKIGAGGMGEVFLAEDTRLKREVAIKILPAGVGSDAERISRFIQEATSISALNHPNILAKAHSFYRRDRDGPHAFDYSTGAAGIAAARPRLAAGALFHCEENVPKKD